MNITGMLTLSRIGLHELDPAFRKITLENSRVKDLVKSLGFHKDPVGKCLPYSSNMSTCGANMRNLFSVAIHGYHEATRNWWRRYSFYSWTDSLSLIEVNPQYPNIMIRELPKFCLTGHYTHSSPSG